MVTRIDSSDRPPEEEVILPVHDGNLRVGADHVDERKQSRRPGHIKIMRTGEIAADAVVLTDDVRGPEICGRNLRGPGWIVLVREASLYFDFIELRDPVWTL